MRDRPNVCDTTPGSMYSSSSTFNLLDATNGLRWKLSLRIPICVFGKLPLRPMASVSNRARSRCHEGKSATDSSQLGSRKGHLSSVAYDESSKVLHLVKWHRASACAFYRGKILDLKSVHLGINQLQAPLYPCILAQLNFDFGFVLD